MVDNPQARRGEPPSARQVFYGRLEYILVCELPDEDFFGALKGLTRLLALITPCNTNGKDATATVTTYSQMTAATITDLQSIEAVVGRVATRNTWGIVDRTDGLAHTIFVDENDEE